MSGSGAHRGEADGRGRPAKGNSDDLLIRQFQTAELHATATLAGWVGHPAVQGIIERHKGEANNAVAPIARHLPSQKEAAAFCWQVYGLAGIGPDWELRRGGVSWALNPVEAVLLEAAISWFRRVVQAAVSELEHAGVAVKPAWAGDHAAVGEMLLLDVPWDLPAAEIAASLHPPGPGAITAGASGTSLRLGTGERAETNLTAIRRGYEKHLNGPRQRAPYAGGRKRAGRWTTAERRDMIAKVLKKFPDATASGIASTFGSYTRLRGGQARSAGGYLRHLLQDADPGGTPKCPPKSTLRDDLRVLRAGKNTGTGRVNPPEDSPAHPA